jgi:hypothetical protein
MLAMLGRFDEARRSNDEAMRLATELWGSVYPGMHEARSRIESLAGDHEAAESFLQTAYEVLVGLGNVANASTLAGVRGRVFLRLGRSDDARRWAGECRDTTASDDVINQHLWRSVRPCSRRGRAGSMSLIASSPRPSSGRIEATT